MLMLCLPQSAAAGDDKQQHFAISGLFGAASETYLHYQTEMDTAERILLATGLGTLPGLAKEISDSTQDDNEFSTDDLTADIAGAFAGAVLSSLFNHAIEIRAERGDEKRISVALVWNFQ
jgi:uncharacterized protein YfiM (DUF2279 family)